MSVCPVNAAFGTRHVFALRSDDEVGRRDRVASRRGAKPSSAGPGRGRRVISSRRLQAKVLAWRRSLLRWGLASGGTASPLNSSTLHPVRRPACPACSRLPARFLSGWATRAEADKNNKEASLGRGGALGAALHRPNERDPSGQMRLGEKLVEVWRKKGREGRTERGKGAVGAISQERRTKESESVRSEREREAQMERPGTILVRHEIVCVRSRVCYS